MKAVRFHRTGPPDVLRVEDVETPAPGPGAVRVAVRAVALNHLDLWVRRGLPIRIEMPHVGGSDFTGVVDAVGDGVESVRVGDAVIGYPLLGYGERDVPEARPRDGLPRILGEQCNGACAEALVLPAANVLPLPPGLDFERAAAVPVVFLTAWEMLVHRGRLAAGETLVVQGAGSGVGTAAVQIGRLLGARVIACTSEPKRQAVAALGADEVLDSRAPGIHRRVLERTEGVGAEVVFEHVGGRTFEESVLATAPGGRLVTCGATTGRSPRLPLAFVFARQLEIHGVTLGSLDGFREVLSHVAAGRLAPVIDRVLPLEACREGHEVLEAGESFGKIVLRVDGR